MIRGIHVGKNGYEIAKIDGSLKSLYQVCKCDLIDIVVREIDGHAFDFVCDDEGLFKDKIFCTVHSKSYGPSIVNDVFICSHNGGDLESLTDEEIEIVKNAIHGSIVLVD